MTVPITQCYNSELEENILCSLFRHQSKQNMIFDNLKEEFFPDSINRKIFKYAKELYLNGEHVDSLIIQEHFKDEIVSARINDILCCDALEVFTLRNCKMLFDNYVEKLIKESETIEDFLKIEELRNSVLFEENKIVHISYNADNFLQNYKEKQEASVITLYSSLDEIIGSFMGGNYIVLGGATGMGKTSFALNIARNVCMQDKTVLYFSLEMLLDELQNRFVCMNEGIDAGKYRRFDSGSLESEKYQKGLLNLQGWNLNVVCDGDITPEKMRMYIQKQKKKGLDFVILDYLGLMSGYLNKSLYEKMTILSRTIKLLAIEFNIPILCLVQLNRDLKARDDKHPRLSDIRESGAIEQDADFILFVHREGYYDANKPQNELEIIVAKNRHGISNKVTTLDYNLETQLIQEYGWKNK